MDAWYPYYAGFAADFARRVLRAARLPSGAIVLDPWNGAGTTTAQCTGAGLRSIGADINPVASLVASAKLARRADAEHVVGLASRLAREARQANLHDYRASRWASLSTVAFCSAVRDRVLQELGTDGRSRTINPLTEVAPPLAAFLLVALLRAAKATAKLVPTTNPTWIRPGGVTRLSRHHLETAFIRTISEMAQELRSCDGPEASISIADARALPIDQATIDLVLTSPPYCTRIDYVVNTSFELSLLGVDPTCNEFGDLRRATMGTPLTRKRKLDDPPREWSEAVCQLLKRIREHSSQDSSSYYYKTYFQYFNDAHRSLGEIRRVLRPGGVAVLVLQTSFYKDVPVDLPAMYSALSEELGFKPTTLSSHRLERVMTQINSKARGSREPSDYAEAVLALEAQ
jgi:DNA modification methylase